MDVYIVEVMDKLDRSEARGLRMQNGVGKDCGEEEKELDEGGWGINVVMQ